MRYKICETPEQAARRRAARDEDNIVVASSRKYPTPRRAINQHTLRNARKAATSSKTSTSSSIRSPLPGARKGGIAASKNLPRNAPTQKPRWKLAKAQRARKRNSECDPEALSSSASIDASNRDHRPFSSLPDIKSQCAIASLITLHSPSNHTVSNETEGASRTSRGAKPNLAPSDGVPTRSERPASPSSLIDTRSLQGNSLSPAPIELELPKGCQNDVQQWTLAHSSNSATPAVYDLELFGALQRDPQQQVPAPVFVDLTLTDDGPSFWSHPPSSASSELGVATPPSNRIEVEVSCLEGRAATLAPVDANEKAGYGNAEDTPHVGDLTGRKSPYIIDLTHYLDDTGPVPSRSYFQAQANSSADNTGGLIRAPARCTTPTPSWSSVQAPNPPLLNSSCPVLVQLRPAPDPDPSQAHNEVSSPNVRSSALPQASSCSTCQIHRAGSGQPLPTTQPLPLQSARSYEWTGCYEWAMTESYTWLYRGVPVSRRDVTNHYHTYPYSIRTPVTIESSSLPSGSPSPNPNASPQHSELQQLPYAPIIGSMPTLPLPRNFFGLGQRASEQNGPPQMDQDGRWEPTPRNVAWFREHSHPLLVPKWTGACGHRQGPQHLFL